MNTIVYFRCLRTGRTVGARIQIRSYASKPSKRSNRPASKVKGQEQSQSRKHPNAPSPPTTIATTTQPISKTLQPFPRLSAILNPYTSSKSTEKKGFWSTIIGRKERPDPALANKSTDRQLIYIGPQAPQVLAYRIAGAVFIGVGAIGIPGMLTTGQAPLVGSVAVLFSVLIPVLFIRGMTSNYVTRLYVHISHRFRISPLFDYRNAPPRMPGGKHVPRVTSRDPRDLVHIRPDTRVTMETYSRLGALCETSVRIDQLERIRRLRGLEYYTWFIKPEVKGDMHRRFYVDGPMFTRRGADMACRAVWACVDEGTDGVKRVAREAQQEIIELKAAIARGDFDEEERPRKRWWWVWRK